MQFLRSICTCNKRGNRHRTLSNKLVRVKAFYAAQLDLKITRKDVPLPNLWGEGAGNLERAGFREVLRCLRCTPAALLPESPLLGANLAPQALPPLFHLRGHFGRKVFRLEYSPDLDLRFACIRSGAALHPLDSLFH